MTTPTASVDAKGLSCPLPVVRARLAMDKLAAGDVLEVVATDPASVPDFENWARMAGHDLVSSSEDAGVYTHVVRKGA